MFKKLHNNQGFTLIELFTAMIILAITGAALYFMVESGLTIMHEQEHRRIAFELAQKRMSAFKFLSDYHDPGHGRDVFRVGTTEGTEVIDADIGDYDDPDETALTAEYTVEVERSSYGDYVIVSVEYRWRELSGAEYNILLKDIYPYKY